MEPWFVVGWGESPADAYAAAAVRAAEVHGIDRPMRTVTMAGDAATGWSVLLEPRP